jgi:hypothetical protein
MVFFLLIKLVVCQQVIHPPMHLIQLITHIKKIYNLHNIFMGCNKHTWFNRFIIFSRLFNYFLLLYTNSIHVCRKINELKKIHAKKIFFWIFQKTMYFPSQNFVLWKNKFEYYNFLANHVISVKDAKVLH